MPVLTAEMGRFPGTYRRKLACHTAHRYSISAHIRVGYMPRPLPVYSGLVQGRLCRSRQLSGSSSISEVPCQSSTNCVIKPATTKAENAGTVAAPSCQLRTKIQPGAPRNTFVRDAMAAKMFSKTSWLLAGSATTSVTGEKCPQHRKTTGSSFVSDCPRGVGSFPRRQLCHEFCRI